MIRACGAGKYKGQQLSQLPGSATAFCQPQEKGRQLCAILVVYPEKRVYAYKDARRYTAIAQAKTWFNIIVDENTQVLQCRSETE